MKNKTKFFLILYLSTFLLFTVYFIFVYENNFKKHKELNDKKSRLESNILNAKNQVNNTYTFEQLMTDSILLEQYAREQLNMQKQGEEVFNLVYE